MSTPTTEEVRSAFASGTEEFSLTTIAEALAEFDAWLAEHDKPVRVLRAVLTSIGDYAKDLKVVDDPNVQLIASVLDKAVMIGLKAAS